MNNTTNTIPVTLESIARQKAEFFARFDRGAGKDNFIRQPAFHSLHSNAYRKIGFARTRGTYAEYYRILSDCVDVRFLPHSFALYWLAAEGYAYRAGRKFGNIRRPALFGKSNAVRRPAAVYPLAVFHKHQQVFYDFLRDMNVFVRA